MVHSSSESQHINIKIVTNVRNTDNLTMTAYDQGVYRFNWTNFQEIPGGISRKIQDMFSLLWHATQCTESTSLPKYRTKTWYAQHGAVAKIKKGDQFLK